MSILFIVLSEKTCFEHIKILSKDGWYYVTIPKTASFHLYAYVSNTYHIE